VSRFEFSQSPFEREYIVLDGGLYVERDVEVAFVGPDLVKGYRAATTGFIREGCQCAPNRRSVFWLERVLISALLE